MAIDRRWRLARCRVPCASFHSSSIQESPDSRSHFRWLLDFPRQRVALWSCNQPQESESMNRNSLTLALCLWGAVALASPPNPEDVAKRLVQSTGIAQGDLVRVSGSTKDLPLLTAIALEVQKAGGASFFDLTSDESVRRICHEVPAERDAGNASATLKLISAMTADISVSPGTNPQLCSDVDPARLAARGKAFQEANAAYTKGGIKAINLGNG
ncbi:MAG: hypothetical protein EHM78_14950, partial [Myxococcaceae bacterium]